MPHEPNELSAAEAARRIAGGQLFADNGGKK